MIIKNVVRMLKEFGYLVKCHINPYNVVTANSLPKTYVDKDELLFHTNFQILVNFIENESPFGKVLTSKDKKTVVYKNVHHMLSWLENWKKEAVIYQVEEIDNIYEIRYDMIMLYHWYLSTYPSLKNLYRTSFALNRDSVIAELTSCDKFLELYHTTLEYVNSKAQNHGFSEDYLVVTNLDAGLNTLMNKKLHALIDLRTYMWT